MHLLSIKSVSFLETALKMYEVILDGVVFEVAQLHVFSSGI